MLGSAILALFLDLPPVPLPGPRPWLGARANHLRFFVNPVAAMVRLHAKYGAIAALSRDDPSFICAFGARFNHQLLSNGALFPNFAEALVRVPDGSAAAKFNVMLVGQNGEVHRRNRRLMMPAFSKARLAEYDREIMAIGQRELADWPTHGLIDIKRRTIDSSLRVALKCLFGLDVGGDGRELGQLSLEYLSLLTSPGAMLLPFAMPGLPYARYLAVCERLAAMLGELIVRKREQDLGDDILSALVASDEGGGFSSDEIIGQVVMLLTASHETTAMTLSWTLLLLAAHPSVQVELAEAIESRCKGSVPSLADLEQVELLGWVISESMRLLPAAPMLFFRRSSAPFELDGHRLPAGTTVVLSPLITHRDPVLYPEPLRFDPERWRTLEPSPYEYLPFGAGPRRCLGAGFAGNAIRLLLAAILQRVRVEIPDGGVTVDAGTSGIVMSPLRPLRLRVSPAAASLGQPKPVRGNVTELVSLPRA